MKVDSAALYVVKTSLSSKNSRFPCRPLVSVNLSEDRKVSLRAESALGTGTVRRVVVSLTK